MILLRSAMGVLFILGLLMGLSACPVETPRIDELGFACTSDDNCSGDWSCVEGVCVNQIADVGLVATDASDAAVHDSHASDLRASDLRASDLWVSDIDTSDTGTTDIDTSDTGTADSGTPDSSTPDTGASDTGAPDSCTPDSSVPDSAAPDSSISDTSAPDTAAPDTAAPDTAAPDTAAPDTSSPDPWWDEAWSRRRKLTMNNGDQTQDLVDFPLLVVLRAGRVDYSQTQDLGEDVRFVDADGGTVLAHEIERWDEGGDSLVWVRVPRVDAASADDFIWLYFGSSSAVDAQQPAAVWSAGYEAVYHLGPALVDSTGSGFTAGDHGSSDAAGVVARARAMDGVGAWLDIGSDRSILRRADAATLSVWLNTSDANRIEQLISISINNGGQPTGSSRAWLEVNTYNVRLAGRSTDGEGAVVLDTIDAPLAGDRWTHLVGVIDYSTGRMEIYIDGQPHLQGVGVFGASQTPDTNADSCAIGAQDSGGGQFFAGLIDEVRVARAVRSADWIAAEHLSETDASFITFGPEQTR